jgi:hypothetical protein
MRSLAFARIYKVDEKTRTVVGRATQEVIDKDNEVMDYASSKPEFQRWSAEVFADSGGKSYGNVRSMHSNVAAGKLTDIEFNDAEKAIDVSAMIVDDNEWAKVLEGVHTGFSIGGRYCRRWADVHDGKVVQRYTAMPTEISIVDRPCNPAAKFFTVTKRDGSVEKRAFAPQRLLAFENGKVAFAQNGDVSVFKSIHRQGARPLPADFLHKYEPSAALKKDAPIAAIRKAQAHPHGLHPSGQRMVNTDALKKMLARARRLRKGLPPQNANGENGGALADDGATTATQQQETPSARTTQLGPRHAASITDGRLPATQEDETVQALKRIFAAGPNRSL